MTQESHKEDEKDKRTRATRLITWLKDNKNDAKERQRRTNERQIRRSKRQITISALPVASIKPARIAGCGDIARFTIQKAPISMQDQAN